MNYKSIEHAELVLTNLRKRVLKYTEKPRQLVIKGQKMHE